MNIAQDETGLHIERHGNLSEADILEEMREHTRHALLDSTADVAGPPVVPPKAARQADLRDLLAPDGTAFIETAFNAILRRPCDPKALTHYAGQIATGQRSKIEILGELRYGAEGRKAGVRVPGLLSRYIAVRSTRLPGIGPYIRLLVRIIRWPRQVRRVQIELLNSSAVLRSTIDNLQGALANIEWRVARMEADAPSQATHAQVQEVDARVREIDARLNELSMDSITSVAAVLRGLRSEHGWPDEDASAFAARLTAVSRDVVRRAAQAEETAQRNRVELLDQSRRLGLLLSDVRRRLDKPFSPEEVARLEEADDHRLDPLYVAFEDRLRGDRLEIRERQREHLPRLREAKAGSNERPIVDVGAGRGEWLELLREEGLSATGVDLNRNMVELCRSLHLDCIQEDAIDYLRQLPDNSQGAITGFHIIEHLPFKTFVALLDESLRVLKPDGLILFETPNPANVLVGSCRFYLDPTHRNPMPFELTSMIAEARGFVEVQIQELHPMGVRFQGRDEVLAAQLDRIIYGPQDYALIARKP